MKNISGARVRLWKGVGMTFCLLTLILGCHPAQGASANSRLAYGAHEVDLGEVRLHYVVHGRGRLLFAVSPGWGVGSVYLQRALAPLEAQITLIFVDTRGSGGSTRPADPSHMSHAAMADDLNALRAKLGLQTINLFGHSDGGCIAIEFAERHPDRIHKLVLVAPSVLGDRERQATEGFLELWADDPQYRDAVQKVRDSDSVTNPSDEEFERSLSMMLPLYTSDPSRYLKAVEDNLAGIHLSAYASINQEAADRSTARDQRANLKLIQAPTLIINGTVDFICPYQVAQRLHAAIAHSQLSLYANKARMPWIEARPRFFADLSGFLRE